MTTTILKHRLVPLLLAACFGAAVAAPTGQQVVAGQATFSQQGNVFSITNTPGTIINWQSFSINQGEITRFIQQSSDSAVLNRIVGQDPSRILGALQSNGKVFLINPNGILFGRDSRVDVNGLVASTLNLSNADFLAGKKNFTAGAAAGEVRNEGAITTPAGGQVFLVAPNVTNTGIITSPKGDVVLAAGHSVQLVDSRDPDLQVVVSAPLDASINLGQVVAQGGRIGIYGALVNQRGIVNANSAVVGENGKIVLKASRDTLLEQGSVTSATGAGKGGDVHLLGERVSVTGNAQVDASGALGGGSVLVGGDWQGKNAGLPNARETVLGQDASIKADATVNGDGGKVVLWSDGATRAAGSISARAGRDGGNGGKIETSGHDLRIDGIRVDAGAAKGKSGNWLLDPYDIEVVEAGSTATPGDVASPEAGPSTGVTKIAPSVLTGTNADIVLQAAHDITVTDAISTPKGLTATAGNDINVKADVTSSGGDIQFNAGGKFDLASGVTVKGNKNIDVSADQMNLAGSFARATSGSNLIVGLTPRSDALPINVGGTNDGLMLWLDPARLASISAYELNLGTSGHAGGVFINDPVNLAGHFVMDTAGKIEINAPVTLGATSNFIAALHGDPLTLLDVNAAITAKNVTLYGDGLRIAAPITASGSATFAPHNPGTEMNLGSYLEGDFSLTYDMLSKVTTPSLKIGGKEGQAAGIRVSSALDLTNHPFGTLTLDAGDGDISMAGILTMPSGVVSLKSTAGIWQETGAALFVDKLAVQGGDVMLGGNNKIHSIAGTGTGATFRVNNWGDLLVGQVGSVSGISATSADIELWTHASESAPGKLTIGKLVDAGANRVTLAADLVDGSGTIKADRVNIESNADIGAVTALKTQTNRLQANGAGTINISNTGDLILERAYQYPSETDNTGSTTISTTGNLTVPAGSIEVPHLASTESFSVPGSVTTGSGAITLKAGGNMTIGGSVQSDSGNVSLTAGKAMLVSGQVVSSSGNISMTGGRGMEISGTGQVVTMGGNVNLLADNGSKFTTATGAIVHSAGDLKVVAGAGSIAEETVSADGKLTLEIGTKPDPGQPKPSVDQCVANPNATGCGSVIDDAKRACAANWNAGHCDDVMPKPAFCKTNPTALGCDAVIKRDAVLQCAANPRGANCSDVLPKYDECKAQPGALGCDAVIKQHDNVSACLANPTPACYSEVLPTFDACSKKPDTFGCSPVVKRHDDIAACITNPKGANCSSVLPPLATCHANAGEFGCQPVLAREKFDACVANASGPGCDAILPQLDVCKTNPAEEGCGAVIRRTFDFCLSSPNDARCVGVLPTISQCVDNKGKDGCQVVLPRMEQCIGSPTLQGCSVVLPALEQCAANPNQQGCEAVLPRPDFCGSHPGDPSCAIFTGNGGSGGSDGKSGSTKVAGAVQQTVTLVNGSVGKTPGAGGTQASTVGGGASSTSGSSSDSSSDKPSDKQSGPAASENSGAKNEKPATKMYCN